MTARSPSVPAGRSRFAILLAAGQARYQLVLLLRSPMGTFTTLIVPLMLLVTLNAMTPELTLKALHGLPYAQFLTPAMATFALVNGSYVNVITSVVVAREGGILKRLHGTPLPLWAYAVGRMVAAGAVCTVSLLAVFAVGALFLHVPLSWSSIASLAGIVTLGIAVFTTLALAVTTFTPRPDTALPIAYGTLLPVAFISNVFFPATSGPAWLEHVAAAFPLAPIADSAERVFAPGSSAWPMTSSELRVLLCWLAGAAIVTSVNFRWQPGGAGRIHLGSMKLAYVFKHPGEHPRH